MAKRKGAVEDMVAGRLPSPEFWLGRRVFLTGHTGFKGGWLALWLHMLGAKIQGFALPPSTVPNLFTLLGLESIIGHEIGDVRDAVAVQNAVQRFSPEIIIHMAAQPLVLLSYEQPVETYATNVMGTVHVLEAARRCDETQVTLIVTSDKCYENHDVIWGYREHDPKGGHDPYSNSKGCAELVTSAYANSYFAPALRALGSVRAGNVIGGGDWSRDRLMTDLVAALLQGQPPALRAPGAVRPWQHVLEPLSGYLVAIEALAESRAAGAAWNFGPAPSSEVAVAEIAEKICGFWGGGIKPIIDDTTNRGSEAQFLALDSTKARRELGWLPRWGLDDALAQTVSWYREWQRGADMREVTQEQITRYCGGSVAQPHKFAEIA
ncbi:MAG: CDP-glucose 4,6-dehydratase [Acidocella sp.]|nr:CDP-glucose 4,6-dehydratase [Acidocella sp.]